MQKTIIIDKEKRTITTDGKEISFASAEAFALLSDLWLQSEWDCKYSHSFTWLGRPIMQLPDDLLRLQEVIFKVKPTLIIETGIAAGGSLLFYATLLHALGKGRVIGIDKKLNHDTYTALTQHRLGTFITMFEGNSVDPKIVEEVKKSLHPEDIIMVLLDSSHSFNHVTAELNAYAPLVSVGSYIIVMDGIMERVVGSPRSHHSWHTSNPARAARTFVEQHPHFQIEQPSFLHNDGMVTTWVTRCPDGFIKKRA